MAVTGKGQKVQVTRNVVCSDSLALGFCFHSSNSIQHWQDLNRAKAHCHWLPFDPSAVLRTSRLTVLSIAEGHTAAAQWHQFWTVPPAGIHRHVGPRIRRPCLAIKLIRFMAGRMQVHGVLAVNILIRSLNGAGRLEQRQGARKRKRQSPGAGTTAAGIPRRKSLAPVQTRAQTPKGKGLSKMSPDLCQRNRKARFAPFCLSFLRHGPLKNVA